MHAKAVIGSLSAMLPLLAVTVSADALTVHSECSAPSRRAAHSTFILQLSSPSWTPPHGAACAYTPIQYIGHNGFSTDNVFAAVVWTLLDGELFSVTHGGAISLSSSTGADFFAPHGRVGSILTNFSIHDGSVVWSNSEFPGGKAGFCQRGLDGAVVAYGGAAPAACTPIHLTAITSFPHSPALNYGHGGKHGNGANPGNGATPGKPGSYGAPGTPSGNGGQPAEGDKNPGNGGNSGNGGNNLGNGGNLGHGGNDAGNGGNNPGSGGNTGNGNTGNTGNGGNNQGKGGNPGNGNTGNTGNGDNNQGNGGNPGNGNTDNTGNGDNNQGNGGNPGNGNTGNAGNGGNNQGNGGNPGNGGQPGNGNTSNGDNNQGNGGNPGNGASSGNGGHPGGHPGTSGSPSNSGTSPVKTAPGGGSEPTSKPAGSSDNGGMEPTSKPGGDSPSGSMKPTGTSPLPGSGTTTPPKDTGKPSPACPTSTCVAAKIAESAQTVVDAVDRFSNLTEALLKSTDQLNDPAAPNFATVFTSGFTEIISAAGSDLVLLTKLEPFDIPCDATAVSIAGKKAIAVQQSLLKVISGKNQVLEQIPAVGSLIAASLRNFEGVAEKLALTIIDLIPTLKDCVQPDIDALKDTLAQSKESLKSCDKPKLCADGDIGQLAKSVVDAIDEITKMSQDLQAPATGLSAITSIVTGLGKVTSAITKEIGILGSVKPLDADCDQAAVSSALSKLIAALGGLVSDIASKAASIPLAGVPVAVALKALGPVVDNIVKTSIGLIPGQACFVTAQLDTLSMTLKNATSALS